MSWQAVQAISEAVIAFSVLAAAGTWIVRQINAAISRTAWRASREHQNELFGRVIEVAKKDERSARVAIVASATALCLYFAGVIWFGVKRNR